MKSFLKPKREEAKPSTLSPQKTMAQMPQKTTYSSNPVVIPEDFLKKEPHDARPVTASPIDWSKTVLPQNGTRYAIVLDNVLSLSECAELIRLAEASVPVKPSEPSASGETTEAQPAADPWQPALVNIGAGFEVLMPDYRNSDRIIWDSQEIADRLWQRCVAGCPSLMSGTGGQGLAAVEGKDAIERIVGSSSRADELRWEFRRLNERMRFLRYGPGQFFRPHCDGPYRETREDGRVVQTLFTLHLYLNDAKVEAEKDEEGGGEGNKADLVGGATSFLSTDEKKKVDVNPKAGRVLIFQHRSLYHAGDDVLEGTKYTVRTDIMYEMVSREE